MKIDASELDALGRGFAIGGERIGACGARAVRAAGQRMEQDARGRAPRATGTLAGSIGSTITGDGRFGSMTLEVIADVRYSGYVEEGTSDTAPQPFLGPTFDAQMPSLEAELLRLGAEVI